MRRLRTRQKSYSRTDNETDHYLQQGVVSINKLVIHPKDHSTVFLNKVYENLEEVTLVQGGVDKEGIKDMIVSHDQVMMMGHGTADGLLSVGQFPNVSGYIIDDSFAPLLADKNNSVFIWCNASQYVINNDLSGFYTGMFISEVAEADLMGLRGITCRDVDESNRRFVETVGKFANSGTKLMHAAAKHKYGKLVWRNRVAKYNHERLYVN